tara:strand:+ start:1952 stop:2212 length:261 start_codon:yes stop_codon:yes gene_type:complete
MELTPKEKAKELVMKFQHIVTSWDCYNDEPLELEYMMGDMKKCALICLDEKQKTIDKMFNGYYTMPKEWQKEYDELEEVKEEINKL